MRKFTLAVFIIATFISGCADQPGTIRENVTIGDKINGLVTDARQRLISATTIGTASRPGLVDPDKILCVEPSPDVAVAVAQSTQAALAIVAKGSGSYSNATVEGITQLATRTTALQAILTRGYHSCLEFANGAMSATDYSLRQSRIDDLIATLIISENISGAFARNGGAIATSADGSASASASGLKASSADVKALRKELAETETNIKAKEKQISDKKAEIADAETKNENTDAKNGELKGLESELAALEAQRSAITRELASSADTLTRSAAAVRSANGTSFALASLDASGAAIQGAMQERFINSDPERTFVAACLSEMGLWEKNDGITDDTLRKFTLENITGWPDGNRPKPTIPITPATDDEDRSEDSDYDKLAFLIKGLQQDNKVLRGSNIGSKIPNDRMSAYFLARRVSSSTPLTDFCNAHLQEIIERSSENRQNLKIAGINLEAKRLDAQQAKQVSTATPSSFVHPNMAFSLLGEAKTSLDAKRAKLNGTAVPAVTAKFPAADKTKIDTEKVAVIASIDAAILAATNVINAKADVDAIEAGFVALVGDTRSSKSGAPHELWTAEFNLLSVKAKQKAAELSALKEKLAVESAKGDAMITKITNIQS